MNIDKETYEELRAKAAVIDTYNHVIEAALNMYVERMTEHAESAKAAYEAGAGDGLITNNGHHQMAELFTQSATKAKAARKLLDRAVNGDDSDYEEDE